MYIQQNLDKRINEGMRVGDLADLVLPLISVDEWISKADPEQCIAIGFYVHDEDAAKDLNRFLQKSSIRIVDTEVSPAPDQHGYFMVFIEIQNNARLAENINAILAEIKSLVDIEDWQMRVRKNDGLVAFSEENLKKCLDKIKKQEKGDDILEFLRPSMLSNASIEDRVLILEGGGERHVYRIKDFDRLPVLMENNQIDSSPISYDLRTVAKMNRIVNSLGEDWQALKIEKFILLHNFHDPRGLLLSI